jgi:hypothetical protein
MGFRAGGGDATRSSHNDGGGVMQLFSGLQN